MLCISLYSCKVAIKALYSILSYLFTPIYFDEKMATYGCVFNIFFIIKTTFKKNWIKVSVHT